MSGFIYYLIIFYSKYFEGTIYLNYSIGAISDAISYFYVIEITKYRTVTQFLRFLIGMMIAFTGLLMIIQESGIVPDHIFVYVLCILVILIRL